MCNKCWLFINILETMPPANMPYVSLELYFNSSSALIFTEKFVYLGFTSLSTLQVISRWIVGRAEETSTYSSLGFCTVNC